MSARPGKPEPPAEGVPSCSSHPKARHRRRGHEAPTPTPRLDDSAPPAPSPSPAGWQAGPSATDFGPGSHRDRGDHGSAGRPRSPTRPQDDSGPLAVRLERFRATRASLAGGAAIVEHETVPEVGPGTPPPHPVPAAVVEPAYAPAPARPAAEPETAPAGGNVTTRLRERIRAAVPAPTSNAGRDAFRRAVGATGFVALVTLGGGHEVALPSERPAQWSGLVSCPTCREPVPYRS